MFTDSTIEILQKFDKKELLKLGDFTRSPYLNSVEIVIKMFDEVAKCHPQYNSPKLSYEKMWKKLYPAKPYNDKIIRNRLKIYSARQNARVFLRIQAEFVTYLQNDQY